jgi:PP-loop superfamily ATP-utilizing enzyme
MVERSWAALDSLRGASRWLLALSGGKDSTSVLVLAVEFLRRRRPACVSLEIPPMARHAEGLPCGSSASSETRQSDDL